MKGAGVTLYISTAVLEKNTISENSCETSTPFGSGAGLFACDYSSVSGHSNIIYGNNAAFSPDINRRMQLDYSCCSDTLNGIGNIMENPQFVNPFTGNFNLQCYSPCIDAGSPEERLDPDNTRADMGALYYNQNNPIPALNIIADPEVYPISIPPQGGGFNYLLSCENTTPAVITFDVWIMVNLPNGREYGPILNVPNLELPPLSAVERIRTQSVPGSALPGLYIYDIYAGLFPDSIVSEYHFDFTKERGLPFDYAFSDWSCAGEEFSGDYLDILSFPESNLTASAYPNPFNQETVITIYISQNSAAKIRIFDIAGRLIETVVDDYYSAGVHNFKFDSGYYASGIYFAMISANGKTQTLKLAVMK